jgi:hypothetical protein
MKKILLSLLTVLLFTHCTPEEPPIEPTDYLRVNDTLKSYYYFPVGSWWVYKMLDTNATIYDTAIVVRSISEVVTESFSPEPWEHVAVNIEHTHYPSRGNAASPYLNVLIDNYSGRVDRISMTSQGDLFPSLSNFLSTPLDSILMSEKSRGGGLTYLQGVNISILGFNEVLHLKYGAPGFYDDLMIARNVGFIKYFNFEDKTSWELVNYEIKK